MNFQIDQNNLDFMLLNVGYAEHFGDWNWKNICSPFVRLHFVKKGTAKILYGPNSISLKENHIYLTPSYIKHSYVCDGEFNVFYLHLYEKLENNSSIFDSLSFPLEIESDALLNKCIERLYTLNPNRELLKYDPTSYDNTPVLIKNISLNYGAFDALKMENQAIIKLILSRFLHLAKAKTDIRDERILRSLTYIHSHIEQPITLEEIADFVHLSKDHLIRLFKKHLGCTPIRYINQKKIEKAQLLILVENMSLKNIAYRLGFDNIPYFNRLFKQLTGETPSTYHKKN